MKTAQIRILIADDERNLREVLSIELSKRGHSVGTAENGLKALDLLDKSEYDVLLLDLNMPGLGGIEVLKKIKYLEIPTEVIVLTANATVPTAVESMKLGAYDYVTKPFNLEELAAVVAKANEKKKLVSENMLLKTQIRMQAERGHTMIAKSPVMLQLLETVRKVAGSGFPLLISGESGSGKEVIAKTIHELSAVADGPFVAINCGAIPETMIESELFGFEKGAFTSAVTRKAGLLEVASNGTLFLDEIGEMPLQLQVKLLRVIETERFFRLGSTRELKVNLRIIAATNKDLKSEIEKGTFRPDLYYRLTALIISVPPLRERREDIPAMIEHFRDTTALLRHKKFSRGALEVLKNYSWPGNVRELKNIVHRTLLLSRTDEIEPSDLPPDLLADNAVSGATLADMERSYILKVLRDTGGQRGKAAEILGVSPKTLYRKLLSYGIKG